VTTLNSTFEDDLREAVVDRMEARAEELGQTWLDVAQDAFQSYAASNGYDIQHIWEDADGPFVERRRSSVTVRIQWPGLTALFEWGVNPHVIRGNPLAFRWESPPEGTRPPDAPPFVVAEEVNWGSVTGGIPEARAIRAGRDAVGNELRTN
jgi:hypothetical protein